MVRKNRFNHPSQAYAALTEIGNEAFWAAQASGATGPIFAQIAKQKSHGYTASDGGIHDWTTQGALKSQEIDRLLFSLQVGQMSDIVETDIGFHIVRVLERKQAGRTPFTEVQADIVADIKEERFRAAVDGYLAKLRRNARVWSIYTGDTSVERLAQPPVATQTR